MMPWQIKRALARISRRADPDAGFAASLRTQLEALGYLPSLSRGSFAWKLAGGMVSLGLVVSIATAGYAYASDEVLPDTPLYPLRETLENVETRIAPMVARIPKEQTNAKMLRRRIKELTLLRAKKKVLKSEAAEKMLAKIHADIPEATSTKELPEAVLREARRVEAELIKETSSKKRIKSDDAKEATSTVREVTTSTHERIKPKEPQQKNKKPNPRRTHFESFEQLR